MKSTAKIRHLLFGVASLMATVFLVSATPTPVNAATVSMSGTVLAGGSPAPRGTVQVAFVQYVAGTTCTYPTATTGKIVVAMVGADGTFSQDLDMTYPYRVIFRPMTTAPNTALWRLYKSGTPDGVTQFGDSTCLTSLSGAQTNINLSTTAEGVKVSGSLSTSTGLPVTTNAIVILSRNATSYFLHGDGYIQKVSESGIWDLSGIDKNQPDLFMQVNVNGTLFSIKRVGSAFTVIPFDMSCGDACKFPIGASDISNINLRLPVTGSISGTISGPNGIVGQGQVCAVAYRDGGTAATMYSMEAGRSCADAAGRYMLGLTFGSYRLQFQNNGSAPFKSLWHNGVSNASGYFGATVIVLSSGTNASKVIDPLLEEGKSIKGRVTNSDGLPIKGASVSAMTYNPQTSMTFGVGGTNTAEDGSYTLAGLEPATYILMASHPDYGMMFLGGSRETATQFVVASDVSGVVGKDISFPRGFAVSGTLSTGDNSEGRVCVSAYRTSNSSMGWGEFVGSNCFSAPGPWKLKGLKSGSYKIRFDAQTGNLRSVFLGGTADFNDSTTLEILSTDIANRDVTIPAGKSISGRIVNDEGQAVQSACVIAFKQMPDMWGWGQAVGSSCTSTTGEYKIRGLENGNYKLRIETPPSSDYMPGFFSEETVPVKQVENAQVFEVSASRSGTDQTLKKGPKFTATIMSEGSPVAQVCVSAFKKVDEYGWGEWSGSACSGADGAISIRGVSQGEYTFDVRPQAGNYQNGWYVQNSPTTQTRASATVRTISDTTISLGNITLTSGKSAYGRIVSESGDPLSGVCVGALKDTPNGWGEWSGSACSRKDGRFTILGLDPASRYRFRADVWAGDYKPGFVTSIRQITSKRETTSDMVAAEIIEATTNIDLGDIALPTSPSISGIITSGNNEPESDVCINAHDAITLMWKASSCTQSSGKFALRGLDVGNYKLSWWTQKPTLTNGWYSSGGTPVNSPDNADSLTLTSSGRADLTIRLVNGGKIFGEILNSASSEICVAAWLNNSSGPRDNAAAISCVNSEMKYELKGLLPQTNYYLQVFRKDAQPINQNSPSTDTPYRTGGASVALTVS